MIISNIITLIQKKLPKFVNAKEADIQVLTPMRKGNLGVERLNKILQQYLNPPSPQKQEKEVGDRLLREGEPSVSGEKGEGERRADFPHRRQGDAD